MNKLIKMEVTDLKPGDILLLSPVEGDFLSEAIAWVTNSNVSHAAMSYTGELVVEETPPCTTTTNILEKLQGRQAAVMRLNPPAEDLTKVINVAQKYLNHQEVYPMDDLLFIGIYLLFEKFSGDSTVQKLFGELLKLLMIKLIGQTNEKRYVGYAPMTCSQFVYHCYEEAGNEYQINIHKDHQRNDTNNFLQLVKEQSTIHYTQNSNLIDVLKEDSSVIDTHKLLKELVGKLKVEKNHTHSTQIILDQEFVKIVHQFCSVLTQIEHSGDAIQKVLELKEYFITPMDLLSKCDNLIQVGTM